MDNEKIGKYIKELRTKKNLTQEELAKKIFVSRSVISEIENGKTQINLERAKLLADFFGVTLLDIYNGGKIDKNDINTTNKTVNIINKNEIKKSRFKYKIIISIILIIFILSILAILLYYFFNSYNSVKFYKVVGESENFTTNEGLFVVSKENINFSINVNAKNNQKIDYISLRYKCDDKDELIQKVDANYIYITDYYNYNEFFDYNKIIKEEGTYYIEVEYENDFEIINLSVIKQYENKRIFFRKETPITTGEESHTREELNIPEKILKEFTYEHGAYSYQKKMKGYTVYMGLVPDAYQFAVSEDHGDHQVEYLYYLDCNDLYYADVQKDYDKLWDYEKINEENNYTAYKYFFDEYHGKYFK